MFYITPKNKGELDLEVLGWSCELGKCKFLCRFLSTLIFQTQ